MAAKKSPEAPDNNAISLEDAYARLAAKGWEGMILAIGEQVLFVGCSQSGGVPRPDAIAQIKSEIPPERFGDWEYPSPDGFLYRGTDTRELARIMNILIEHPSDLSGRV